MKRRPLTAPTKKPITLAPIRPNLGIEIEFQRKLDALIERMNKDTTRVILAAYRRRPPEMAQDASPAAVLRGVVRRLASEWSKRFADFAENWGSRFSRATVKMTDQAFAGALRKAGFTVKFQISREVNDITQASVASNVTLIKSIPAQYHKDIEGMVMRSVQAGRDLGSLSAELQQTYGVTKRRAAIIARSQNNLATAAVTKARQQEVGITTAIWLHSSGGRQPRRTHVANSGKPYEIARGWYDPDEKKFILPGQLINCFSGDTVVGLETRPTILWRSPFNGPMIHIRIGPDLLKGTPNHPILTSRGWVTLDQLDRGDKVVCMCRDQGNMVNNDKDETKPTFKQLFEAGCRMGGNRSRDGRGFNFYGDVPDGDIDEVTITDDLLNYWRKSSGFENIGKFSFPQADRGRLPSFFGGNDQISDAGFSGQSRGSLFCFGGFSTGSGEIGVSPTPHQSAPDQNIPDVPSGVTGDLQFNRYRGRPEAVLIKTLDLLAHRVPVTSFVGDRSDASDFFAELVRVASEDNRDFLKFGTFFYEFRGVTDKGVGDCAGHVFTMETLTGHYSVGGARVQAKNCRCVSKAVIPGL